MNPLDFPGLLPGAYRETSQADHSYNCIAWAASDSTRWWWPLPVEFAYWPTGVAREETVTAFVSAFQLLGYEACASADTEPDYEKIAIYVDAATQKPTHMARQLPNGRWTSKLGSDVDIEHNALSGVEGPLYGLARVILT